MMGNKKLQVWLPLLFSLVLIAGMFIGYRLNDNSSTRGIFAKKTITPLQQAIDLIRLKYVDTVHTDSLEGKALQNIMSELDPHSVYLPPADLKEANEDLAGNFEGIGVEFNIFNDTVHVLYVIPGGPSEKAGLLMGDKIIKVNDTVITGKNWNTDHIRRYIRGPVGSIANLQVIRKNKLLNIGITRGRIPVTSVDAAFMMEQATGYIRLNKFSEQSYKEFMKSLEGLKNKGMQSLILDLRGNGGGFMNEAVEMADEFLSGEKLVVYMQGAHTKRRDFRCKRPGLWENQQVVVLVDELSASASEVLAGSLQDWCRAKIIGRRTFGKGLVQEQYSLADGSAIRLTVARYYTPLGRSIQRSYDNGKKVYMDDLWNRYSSGEMYSVDSVRNHQNGKMFINNCNDTLYGGDGITPDIFVGVDTSVTYAHLNNWLGTNNLNNFLYRYYVEHQPDISNYKTPRDFNAGFATTALWDQFVRATAADSVTTRILSNREKEKLQFRMKGLLARYQWRNDGFYTVINSQDPVVIKAMEVLHQAAPQVPK